jgi:nucleoside-diphosphate-sugar epimerase
MTKVLVTGAAGFIGKLLVRKLVELGHHVTCFVLETSPGLDELQNVDVDIVYGNILDPDSLQQPVRDTDVVFHLAGATLARRAQYFQVNQQGTLNVSAACAAAENPPVLVSVSSAAAGGPSEIDRPRKENDPPAPISGYGQSKRAAEQGLAEFADRVPITIVRPPSVFGAEEKYLRSFFKAALRGWIIAPGMTDHRYSLIHVEDLIDGMILAFTHGRRIRSDVADQTEEFVGCYHLAHPEPVTLPEFANLVAGCQERGPVRTIRIPYFVCRTAGFFSEMLSRAVGKPWLLSQDKVREVTSGSWSCDTSRATEELDYRPVDVAERICQTLHGYIERDWR